ncbi:MAG: hypothetical protein ACTSQ8_26460 [Candidatus Helarchaeota archaeon]
MIEATNIYYFAYAKEIASLRFTTLAMTGGVKQASSLLLAVTG